ncbi:putative diphthamide synthesis protein-domain-containing protein [Mucidula mucida]|nr:putative diphthamide synthesis protein-domain-containing protein [Mucidula mucida]
MSENTAFSSAAEDTITRSVDVIPDQSASQFTEDEFRDYYDINDTARWIKDGDYQKIALQFPDELLHDSVPIYRHLKAMVGHRELYVLADTSYGSCCVDEVAAEHIKATAMVHYGHACMSQYRTYRLPVMYVFGKKDVDISHCVEESLQNLPEALEMTLKHDVAYSHVAEDHYSIEGEIERVIHSFQPISMFQDVGKYSVTKSDLEGTILYIGGESLGLTNLLITHSASSVYSYNPNTRSFRLESASTNKLLMRRYAVVQKARDADVFGILVGTLGNHKKSYTISVGKLNPAKLANFMEVECWVLVACPENSMIDAKEFYRPIVTPFELGIALRREPDWTGKYVLDFEQLLAESESASEAKDLDAGAGEDQDGDRPIFSLVSGTFRQAKRYGAPNVIQGDPASQALVVRDSEGTVVKLPDSAAGEFYTNRVYRGLDQRIGEEAPSVLEQGRTGIASGYDDDHRS